MERVEGIEPSSLAWQANALATMLYPHGVPEGIRTPTFTPETGQFYPLNYRHME